MKKIEIRAVPWGSITTRKMDAFSEQLLKLTQLFGTLHSDYTKETSELWAENVALKGAKTLLEAQNNVLIAQVEALRRENASLKEQRAEVLVEQEEAVEEIDRGIASLVEERVEAPVEAPVEDTPVEAPVEEAPVETSVETPVQEVRQEQPNIKHKNRNFQKWCSKLELDDEVMCRVIQNGFTCQFTISKNSSGKYYLRSEAFEGRDLNIVAFSPSVAVQNFRKALKDMGKAYANRTTFDANGWEIVEVCIIENDAELWIKIGDDTTWGIHWDTSVGEWVSN